MRVNVEGSLNVFESMKLFNIKRVLNLSTEEIYGNFLNDVIDEDGIIEDVISIDAVWDI